MNIEYLEKYNFGRCHLFAIVAAEILNTDISVLWDVEAYDENFEIIPELCLVHAFITLDIDNEKYIFDINGLTSFEEYNFDKFPCNEGEFESFNISEFKNIYIKKKWFDFEINEYFEIKEIINHNFKKLIKNYQ